MFEAVHTERSSAEPAAVWALWSDPGRWREWNEQVVRAEADGELVPGTEVRVRYRRGGTARVGVLEHEPERLLVTETRFPGARQRHEHRLEPGRRGVEITHRISVTGPLGRLWSLLLGRRRMRDSVAGFVKRERELVEPRAPHPRAKRRGRRR